MLEVKHLQTLYLPNRHFFTDLLSYAGYVAKSWSKLRKGKKLIINGVSAGILLRNAVSHHVLGYSFSYCKKAERQTTLSEARKEGRRNVRRVVETTNWKFHARFAFPANVSRLRYYYLSLSTGACGKGKTHTERKLTGRHMYRGIDLPSFSINTHFPVRSNPFTPPLSLINNNLEVHLNF